MSLLSWRKSTSALSYSEESDGTDAYHFTLSAGIYEDLLGAFYRFIRSGQLLCVGRSFGDLLLEGIEFPGGDDCRGMATTPDLAVVGTLEGGADGDDPTWT